MLRALDIRDMVVIDRLEIAFQPGLNVLTGETGAGKSILLDSLGFVLGWRGRANLVRAGADKGEVTAVFELGDGHPAHAILEDAGIGTEDDLILRRTASADGRKTAYINDRRASGETLRRLAETLVELHGQHDDRGLLHTRGHRALLDDFGGLVAKRQTCRSAWSTLRRAEEAVAAHAASVAELQAEEEFLRHAAEELSALSPEPGEEAALDARRRLMRAGARVGEDVARVVRALGGEGAEGMVQDASRWLEDVAGELGEATTPALDALSRAHTELGEASAEVERLMADLNVDPQELEKVEERLFAIRGLARKHDCQPDELADFARSIADRLAALDSSSGEGAALSVALDAAKADYDGAAEALSAGRAKAAKRLDNAMAGELAPLKMERASFTTHVARTADGPDGRDEVEFTVATNPGTPPGPLSKIASGGELSRFLLALKVCLSRRSEGATMIFDEIDRGVGGATADAVGRRLHKLAEAGQVLVVTHSPQVAARGQHHWVVSKEIVKKQTFSRVLNLEHPDRIDEIARMLSGDRITDAARAAAEELLAG